MAKSNSNKNYFDMKIRVGDNKVKANIKVNLSLNKIIKFMLLVPLFVVWNTR